MAAPRSKRYRVDVDFRVRENLPTPDFVAALTRAAERNAALAERLVRVRAEAQVRHAYRFPGKKRRGPSMVSQYRAEVRDRGREVRISNPTERARFFEYGTRPHKIRARPGAASGARGRAIRGAKLLRWKSSPGGQWTSKRAVNHPGQRATLVMANTMRGLAPQFERAIREETGRELTGRVL